MKYIREISLKNFQSHKNTVLKFDNKLNIIVGPSDSGKTSILRAIKWVLYNEPLGDYFIREGESSSSVTIELNNGVKVERYRDKSKNQYNIYRGQEKETYEGFGSGVPWEVSQALGIEKLELDQKESRTINLAEQLEGAFLLSEKASVKASSIGRLVGANIIDDALKESLKDSRNISIKINGLNESNEDIIQELETFKYLDTREEGLKILENLSNKIQELELKQVQLSSLEKTYSKLLGDKEKSNLVLDKLKSLDLAEKILTSLDLKMERYLRLNRLEAKLVELRGNLSTQEEILEKTSLLESLDQELLILEGILQGKLQLYKLDKNLKDLKARSHDLRDKLSKLETINRLDLDDFEKKLVRLKALNRLRDAYISNQTSLSRGREYLKRLGDLEHLEDQLGLINGKFKTKTRLETLNQAYTENKKARKVGGDFLRDKSHVIEEILGQYKLKLEEAETCPLCLSRLDREHIDEVMVKFMEENTNE